MFKTYAVKALDLTALCPTALWKTLADTFFGYFFLLMDFLDLWYFFLDIKDQIPGKCQFDTLEDAKWGGKRFLYDLPSKQAYRPSLVPGSSPNTIQCGVIVRALALHGLHVATVDILYVICQL